MLNLINTLNYCTNIGLGDGIPTPVGKLVHLGVLAIQIVVPIILIIWGMLDFTKALVGQDEEKIKEGQKKFIQRVIAAIIVFLIVAAVNLIIGIVADLGGDGNNANNAWKCARELINGRK